LLLWADVKFWPSQRLWIKSYCWKWKEASYVTFGLNTHESVRMHMWRFPKFGHKYIHNNHERKTWSDSRSLWLYNRWEWRLAHHASSEPSGNNFEAWIAFRSTRKSRISNRNFQSWRTWEEKNDVPIQYLVELEAIWSMTCSRLF